MKNTNLAIIMYHGTLDNGLTKRTGLRRSLFVLAISVATAVQFLLLRAAISYNNIQTITTPNIINDGLVWITPKPDTARQVGYEDEWLMNWKRRHYSPDTRPHCEISHDTPYDDDLLCPMPGYIPARLYSPIENKQYPISRVIFVTWLDRRLGRAMHTSLMTLINHNPEYEFIFFNDEDIDRFLCETSSLKDDFAIPIFSKVRAGAMRSDIWRLLIIQQYGGVYLDSDISALGKLPIEKGDTAVSGIAPWSHLPGKTGGAFEHWAMAFMPHHPFIQEAVAAMKLNLEHPTDLLKDDTPAAEAEGSVTMRLTGPAMYQWTLHKLLRKSKCTKVDNSYTEALWRPDKYCKDMDTFRSTFPEGHRFFRHVNFGSAFSHKLFYPSHPWEKETSDMMKVEDYDDPEVGMLSEADHTFCDAESFEKRADHWKQFWERKIEEND